MDHTDITKLISKAGLLLFFSSLIAMFLHFVTSILLAHILTPSDFGVFMLGLSMVTIAVAVANFDFDDTLTRLISVYRGSKSDDKVLGLVKSAMILSCIFGILVFLVLFILSEQFSLWFNNDSLGKIIRIFSFQIPILALLRCMIAIFRSFNNTFFKAVINDILRSFILILLLFPFLFVETSVLLVSLLWVISLFISFLFALFYTFRKPKKFILKAKGNYLELLKFSMPFYMISLFDWTAANVTNVLVGILNTVISVGYFSVALSLSDIILLVPSSLTFLIMPTISYLYGSKNMKEILELYNTFASCVVILSFPLVLVFSSFAPEIINLLFGKSYLSASIPFSIISIMYFSMLFFSFGYALLIAFGDYKSTALAIIVKFISVIILNFILVPYLGIVGSSFAFGLSMLLTQVIYFVMLLRFHSREFLSRRILLALILLPLLIVNVYISYNVSLLYKVMSTLVCMILFLMIAKVSNMLKPVIRLGRELLQ